MSGERRWKDTSRWDHEWFYGLKPRLKCAWDYMCDKCDTVGVWRFNLLKLSADVGEPISREEFDVAFKGRIVWLSEGKLWIPSFIPHEYRNLSATNQAGRGIMRKVLALAEGLPLQPESEAFKMLSDFRDQLDSQSNPKQTPPRSPQGDLFSPPSGSQGDQGKGKGEGTFGRGSGGNQTGGGRAPTMPETLPTDNRAVEHMLRENETARKNPADPGKVREYVKTILNRPSPSFEGPIPLRRNMNGPEPPA